MLHPQARALLDAFEAYEATPTHLLPPAEARAGYRDRRFVLQPDPPPVAEARDIAADCGHGVLLPLRLYRPLAGTAAGAPAGAAAAVPSEAGADAAPLPVLVYFHGGGWTIGDLDTHDVLCRQLADRAGCAVVAVGYRTGPEHRFPAAVDDALAAVRWVRAQAAGLGLDAGRLAVGGDSAGGNLAAVVSIAARDAADAPPIAFQLLIYPATDMRAGAPSHHAYGDGHLLTRDLVRYFHDHYIDDARHDLDWRASPLLAPDLRGLPPAFVLTAGCDPLHDEGLAYSQRLSEAGVRATHVCFERQIHGFVLMGRVLDEADAAVAMCAGELKRALAQGRE